MQISATLLGENGTTMIKTRKDFPCPFEEYSCRVLPDWIDANGHMNIALYGVVFDRGNYAACDALDLGEDYVERAQHGVFAAETHILYFRELHLDDLIRVRTQIVSVDDKRLHFAHEILSLQNLRARRGPGNHVPARQPKDPPSRSVSR